MSFRVVGSLSGLLLVGVSIVSGAAVFAAEAYDPLAVATASPTTVDLDIEDKARERTIPIRVYLPGAAAGAEAAPAPLVILSHGLGGTRGACSYLGNHWAARGYIVVALQHHGSDDAVWRGLPAGERMAALAKAAGPREFMLRVKDVPAALDQLAKWNAEAGHQLHGRIDLEHVGMSGHSFGAVTTQAVSGQSYALGGAALTDPRIDAALPLSPSPGREGRTPEESFGKVKIPWMLMTGTNDDSPIGGITPKSRLDVFPGLPPGAKYELVLDGALHSAFGDGALPGDRSRRNPNHHKAIKALSTAFWDAYLRDDAAAKRWLDGEEPAMILEKGDRWRKK